MCVSFFCHFYYKLPLGIWIRNSADENHFPWEHSPRNGRGKWYRLNKNKPLLVKINILGVYT